MAKNCVFRGILGIGFLKNGKTSVFRSYDTNFPQKRSFCEDTSFPLSLKESGGVWGGAPKAKGVQGAKPHASNPRAAKTKFLQNTSFPLSLKESGGVKGQSPLPLRTLYR